MLFVMYAMSMLGSSRMLYPSVYMYVFMVMCVDSPTSATENMTQGMYIKACLMCVCQCVWAKTVSFSVRGCRDVLLHL